jgi:hypothetical protein
MTPTSAPSAPPRADTSHGTRRAVLRWAGGAAAAAVLVACKSKKDGETSGSPTGGGNADSGY